MNVKQDKSGDGLPITRIETISDATVDGTRVGFAGLAEADCRDWLLETGDILFSHINSVEHIGKCAVYRGEPEKLIHGMNLLCLRSDASKLLPEFAKYLIRGTEFRTRISNFINKAVNQASVSIGNLKTIPVTVPPVAQQRRIAKVLDQAVELRVKRRSALAQIDSLTQSLFLELFGDPATNPKGWPQTTLGQIIEFVGGSQPARETFTYEPSPDTIRLVQIRDFKSDKFMTYIPRRLARRFFEKDDVMIGRYGPPVFQILRGLSGSYNVALMKALPRGRVLKDFIFHLLQEQRLHSFVVGRSERTAGQSGVNLELLEKYPAYLPPIELQREFARRVRAVERLKTAQRASLAEMDGLFATLQHRAFRGEL
jgi:type I restriction enzyme S subunit